MLSKNSTWEWAPQRDTEQHPKGAESNESPPVMDQGAGNSASRCAVIAREGRVAALLFHKPTSLLTVRIPPLNCGIRDATALPKKPELHLSLHRGQGKAVAAAPEPLVAALEGSARLFCPPDWGFTYLLLLEQPCKPQPQDGLFFSFSLWPFYGADLWAVLTGSHVPEL